MDRIGERKVDSAKKTLTALNPDVDVVTYDVRLGADNILDIIDGYDVIVDGTDNFPTRYLVNDASLLKRIPVVHGSIFRFEGQATVFGSIQAMEAIKVLLQLGDPLIGRLLAYDALEESFRVFKVNRDPDCAACGDNAGDLVIAEYDDLCMPHPREAPGSAAPA
jgi:molybdopterin/thiamine biosynthesis adenylyltransferase